MVQYLLHLFFGRSPVVIFLDTFLTVVPLGFHPFYLHDSFLSHSGDSVPNQLSCRWNFALRFHFLVRQWVASWTRFIGSAMVAEANGSSNQFK